MASVAEFEARFGSFDDGLELQPEFNEAGALERLVITARPAGSTFDVAKAEAVIEELFPPAERGLEVGRWRFQTAALGRSILSFEYAILCRGFLGDEPMWISAAWNRGEISDRHPADFSPV